MNKGLWLYTAGLFLGAILALLLTVPHHSIFAGLAVLSVGAAVLGVAMDRDFGSGSNRRESTGSIDRDEHSR